MEAIVYININITHIPLESKTESLSRSKQCVYSG